MSRLILPWRSSCLSSWSCRSFLPIATKVCLALTWSATRELHPSKPSVSSWRAKPTNSWYLIPPGLKRKSLRPEDISKSSRGRFIRSNHSGTDVMKTIFIKQLKIMMRLPFSPNWCISSTRGIIVRWKKNWTKGLTTTTMFLSRHICHPYLFIPTRKDWATGSRRSSMSSSFGCEKEDSSICSRRKSLKLSCLRVFHWKGVWGTRTFGGNHWFPKPSA